MGSPHEAPLDRMALRQAAQWLMRLHAGAEPAPEAFRAVSYTHLTLPTSDLV